jgi:predicted O-methyltransferase YrrM
MEPLLEQLKALDVWRRRAPRWLWYRLKYPTDLARLLAIDAPRGEEELIALYELARAASARGSIVEIGAFRGSSTVALALGARAGNRPRVYSIDPYENFTGEFGRTFGPHDRPHLLKNLLAAGVAEAVWQIHLPSHAACKAWSHPISLLWIDGDHSYEGVKRDLDAWSRFVIPDGIIVFDDSLDPHEGPARVIQGAVEHGQLCRVDLRGKITITRPTRPLAQAS